MKLSLGQRGDTIVEVLIAIAVVSSVLGITYAAMNRNLLNVRDNQERSEAVKYAQAQLEAIKGAWEAGTLPADTVFCMNGSSGIDIAAAPTPSLYDDDFENNYPIECRYGGNGLYSVAIVRDNVTSVYRVYVRWDKIGGGRNELIMAYRLD